MKKRIIYKNNLYIFKEEIVFNIHPHIHIQQKKTKEIITIQEFEETRNKR